MCAAPFKTTRDEATVSLFSREAEFSESARRRLTETVGASIDYNSADKARPLKDPKACQAEDNLCSAPEVSRLCNKTIDDMITDVTQDLVDDLTESVTWLRSAKIYTSIASTLCTLGVIVFIVLYYALPSSDGTKVEYMGNALALLAAASCTHMYMIFNLLAPSNVRVYFGIRDPLDAFKEAIWNVERFTSCDTLLAKARTHGPQWKTIHGHKHCTAACLHQQAEWINNVGKAREAIYQAVPLNAVNVTEDIFESVNVNVSRVLIMLTLPAAAYIPNCFKEL